MKPLAVGALALVMLIGSLPARAEEPAAGDLSGPSAGHVSTSDYTAYIGRPEAVNCLDVGSQANAQALLRSDPSDPMQLDSDRNGFACEANAEPRDLTPVPR